MCELSEREEQAFRPEANPRMRLCLDELYTPPIAAQLRQRDHDVISVHDRPGLLGTPDRELQALMTAERRAIVTATSPTS